MIIEQAKAVLKIEAQGILGLMDRLGTSFEEMVEQIYASKGRVIVTGIGKSGIVARKIVATLNSTGTRAIFLHPVEAMHGDLGVVGSDDTLLALSNSGETDELNLLLANIRNLGCCIIAFTGAPESTLARVSDLVIDVGVAQEACPMGLAPTASTAAQLAMGDALAVVLIDKRQFKTSDFKKNHPGGQLGQRLASQVAEIMIRGNQVPIVDQKSPMTDTLKVVDRFKLGASLVKNAQGNLCGIITDGDIRRAMVKGMPLMKLKAVDIMTPEPKTVAPQTPVYDALYLMERYQITALPVTQKDNRIMGILHLHDILGKGRFTFQGVNGHTPGPSKQGPTFSDKD